MAREFSIIKSPETAALLVRKQSAPGSIVVLGCGTEVDKPHVITGEGQGQGSVIVFLRKGQSCMVYGNPSVRLFRYK